MSAQCLLPMWSHGLYYAHLQMLAHGYALNLSDNIDILMQATTKTDIIVKIMPSSVKIYSCLHVHFQSLLPIYTSSRRDFIF